MQKTAIYLAFLALFSSIVFGQNQDFNSYETQQSTPNPSYTSFTAASWVSLPNSPNAFSRSCCAVVNINGTDYLYQFGGGNTNGELKRVARLNLTTNQWTSNVTTLPSELSSGTAIPMKGDSVIYVFGGNNNNLGNTYRYNVYTNNWSTMANMPTQVTDAFVVKYTSNLIYVIGGGDGFFGPLAYRTNKVQLYNTNNNTYTTVNNYPINCAMLGGGLYRDTIIAVGGYTDLGNATANCYKGVINGQTHNITWTPIASYPAGPILRMASFTAVKNDGVGVMCTGGAINGSIPTAQTFFWNFCTQQWQNNLPNNALGRSNFKATGRNNEIFMTAGYTNVGVGTTEKIIFSYIDGPCSNMLGINSNSETPDKFSLEQNYPNPFNPVTKIAFSLPQQSNVKMLLFDNTGQQIATLTDRSYNAGNHVVEFNGENYSSGVYFYTMSYEGISLTKKMVLIK